MIRRMRNYMPHINEAIENFDKPIDRIYGKEIFSDHSVLRKLRIPKLLDKLIRFEVITLEQKKRLYNMLISEDRNNWYMAILTIKNIIENDE